MADELKVLRLKLAKQAKVTSACYTTSDKSGGDSKLSDGEYAQLPPGEAGSGVLTIPPAISEEKTLCMRGHFGFEHKEIELLSSNREEMGSSENDFYLKSADVPSGLHQTFTSQAQGHMLDQGYPKAKGSA